MLPCINQATTMTTDFALDMRVYAEAGFESVELWLPKLETFLEAGNSLESAQRLLRSLGLNAVGACAQGDVLIAEAGKRQAAMEQLRHRLIYCQALGAETLVVFAEPGPPPDSQSYKLAATNLAEVCDLASQHEVRIALEFIKDSKFLGSLLTAQLLVKKADRQNLGILFDTFHFYAGISKMEDLETLEDDMIGFVHINDVADKPRETWTDQDRVLPGEGVLPLSEIVGAIASKGYEGHCSLELFNQDLWRKDPFEVARLAHENLTSFLATI